MPPTNDPCYVLPNSRCISTRSCDHGPPTIYVPAKPHIVGYDYESKYIHVRCGMCEKVHVLPVTPAQIAEWLGGRYAQDVFRSFTADQRELLISGTCGACWAKMFGAE